MKTSKFETLVDWLNELENRHQQEIQLGLSRVQAVANTLDLVFSETIVITVAGTNGKGSTVALLESMYHAAGYSVGSYTSPHLIHFNERIKLNQIPLTDAELIEAFEAIEAARRLTHLTYFEMTTLAALWHFRRCSLDVMILEVGLGGRLDATNIIDSDLAIITTIDFDHESYLGHTLEAIGHEKAGILRKKMPCIYADKEPPLSITKQAVLLDAPLLINGEDYTYQTVGDLFYLYYKEQTFVFPKTHFHNNSLAAALMATFSLNKTLPLNATQRATGIKNTVLAGRLQWLKTPIKTLVDVAHNPQSARYLADYLATIDFKGKVHAIFSALTDKDIDGLIFPLKDQVDYWYPALLSTKRAASKEQLLTSLTHNDVKTKLCYNTPVLAYQAACQHIAPDDLIVVYGSFFTVSAVVSFLMPVTDRYS